MKVLFAVNNEDISESIIKLYQKEYKEIISGKNVYYFNAIIKELQRDQSYDRIVISEDLEPYTNSNFDMIDKFLFEQLDKISDEAINGVGADIPIIFIATDRRSKSDNLLTKLFSIGIYDGLLGSDRSIPEVCKLLYKPRTKKEAKTYYKIETDEVNYQAETEDSVSETEIQNILTHYKKLGKNQERYVESFNNIAAQYNDAQLRIITKFLPIGVKAVLEAESPKYQSIMTFGEETYQRQNARQEKKSDLKIGFIETKGSSTKLTKPVVIPSAVNKNDVKTLTKKQNKTEEKHTNTVETTKTENVSAQEIKPKRRGRPRKEPETVAVAEPVQEEQPIQEEIPKKRGRGRPRKEPVIQDAKEEINSKADDEDNLLPGFDEIEENTLPGFDDYNTGYSNTSYSNAGTNNDVDLFNLVSNNETNNNSYEENSIDNSYMPRRDTQDLNRLLSKDRKVVAFIGTSKCGTSFLVNNIADILSKTGISTAILDLTSNKNSYYIYTKNEEELRRKASNCIENLEQGTVDGISVSRDLTVFTSTPGKEIQVQSPENVIESLVRKYSLVILDCDYTTPYEYFDIVQEIYLVQSMDILTIQPLTAFLRELQSRNILEQTKLKAVINKVMKVRSLSVKAIIGGMSCYNDPEMSYMRELFDKDRIQSITIPFDEDALSIYLSGLVDCYVSTNGYSKQFMAELKKLADMVYPLITNKYKPDYTKNNKFANANYKSDNNFSNDMNNTLSRMKNQFK